MFLSFLKRQQSGQQAGRKAIWQCISLYACAVICLSGQHFATLKVTRTGPGLFTRKSKLQSRHSNCGFSGYLGPTTTQNLVVKFDGEISGGVLVENASDDFPTREARKSPSKLRRKFATNFAKNFANWKSLVLRCL